MVEKVMKNLVSSKVSVLDCIQVLVVKNYVPERSYLLAELCNIYLKEYCFPDCGKVSLVAPVFKNVGERSPVKDYRPFSLLSVVAKVFEKLVNDRIVNEPEKCGLSFIFSTVLGLLDQLQIFLQLYLIESVGLLTGLGLLEL